MTTTIIAAILIALVNGAVAIYKEREKKAKAAEEAAAQRGLTGTNLSQPPVTHSEANRRRNSQTGGKGGGAVATAATTTERKARRKAARKAALKAFMESLTEEGRAAKAAADQLLAAQQAHSAQQKAPPVPEIKVAPVPAVPPRIPARVLHGVASKPILGRDPRLGAAKPASKIPTKIAASAAPAGSREWTSQDLVRGFKIGVVLGAPRSIAGWSPPDTQR